MIRMKVRLTLTAPMLGTLPANEQIYRDFIASKAPEEERINVEDEVAALGVDAVAEKGMTIFPKFGNGSPFMYGYMLKGQFKAACSALRKVSESRSSKVKAYKKVVDQMVFVYPAQVPIILSGPITSLERSLRVSAPYGEYTCLAISEQIPAGSTMELTILILSASDEQVVREWLNYGSVHGLGQWRNAGYGTFAWELLERTEIKFAPDEVMQFAV